MPEHRSNPPRGSREAPPPNRPGQGRPAPRPDTRPSQKPETRPPQRQDSRPPREARDSGSPAPGGRFNAPRGSSGEAGWLPDCVYTGEKFEYGVAFFADAVGRISRFSREPADL